MNPIVKRIIGVLLFAGGIGFSVWLRRVYDTGGGIGTKTILAGPAMIIYGAFMAIAPGLVMERGEWAAASGGKRALNVIVTVIALGIAFAVRFTIFKNWK